MDKFSGEKLESKTVEQKEKEPKISYHFLYAPHRTSEDAKKLKSAFGECDIYVPELPGWRSGDLSFWQSVSRGNLTPEELSKLRQDINDRSIWGYWYNVIYKSQKPILFVDLPEGHELERRYYENYIRDDDTRRLFQDGYFDKAIEQCRAVVKEFAEIHLAREEKIKENLKNKIKEFLEDHPEYRRKDELRALIGLGSFHTHLFQDMKKEDQAISREFNEMPQFFPSSAEAVRKAVFKKDINDELLARAIIEDTLYTYLGSFSNNTNKLTRVLRKISSHLDLETSRKISESMAARAKGSILLPKYILVEELEKLNIKIPKSEKEMDEILGIKKE